MAPPPPPELLEDAIAEILLRVPPEEPAHLIRASLVCKLWRRILSDPDFLRHYRRYHRTPPLLGFFRHVATGSGFQQRFVPATASSPFSSLAAFDCRRWVVLDCRHGRVLLQRRRSGNLLVWDPVTGHREQLRRPYHFTCASAAVLCAAANCDHSGCHGGPFQVVCVGFDHFGDWRAHACVYSSQAGAWGEHVHFHLGRPWQHTNRNRAAHIGDGLYFYFAFCLAPRILKYDLSGHSLSEIYPMPPDMDSLSEIALMPTEEVLLGLAVKRESNVYLYSSMVDAEGVAEWVQCRVTKLHKILDNLPNPIAFAEGLNAIFINTYYGLCLIDLKSEEATKVGKRLMNISFNVVPVMSFYTPDCACSKFPFPELAN